MLGLGWNVEDVVFFLVEVLVIDDGMVMVFGYLVDEVVGMVMCVVCEIWM